MPLIPSLARDDRNLGSQEERLGLRDQATLNKPSRLGSKASGQPLGFNYIPPLDLPISTNATMGGGSPTTPAPLQPETVKNNQGIKRRPVAGKAEMTGQ